MPRPFQESSMRRAQRGAALLTVMIVVVVLTIIVAGALTFTGQESASATKHMERERLAACSIAARNFVLSQLRPGAAGRAQNTAIQGSLNTGEFLIRTGHLDQPDGGPGTLGVSACPGTSSSTAGVAGGSMGTLELTNATQRKSGSSGAGGGGGALSSQCLSVVASCQDLKTGASSEVEFQVRLGF